MLFWTSLSHLTGTTGGFRHEQGSRAAAHAWWTTDEMGRPGLLASSSCGGRSAGRQTYGGGEERRAGLAAGEGRVYAGPDPAVELPVAEHVSCRHGLLPVLGHNGRGL